MTNLDFILILLVAGFVWFGFWYGLVHAAGGLLGTIAGAWLASRFYIVLAGPLETLFGYQGPWLKFGAFLGLFVLVNRLVGFGFFVFDKTFAFLVRLPFIKTINRLAGAVLGVAEGMLVMGLTLYFATAHLALPDWLAAGIDASRVAQGLIIFASILIPLLPDFIRAVQPYVPVDLPQP